MWELNYQSSLTFKIWCKIWIYFAIILICYYWFCYCCCFDGIRLCLCVTGFLMGPVYIPQMVDEWPWSSGGMIPSREKDLEKYLTQCHFVHHKSHFDWLGFQDDNMNCDVAEWCQFNKLNFICQNTSCWVPKKMLQFFLHHISLYLMTECLFPVICAAIYQCQCLLHSIQHQHIPEKFPVCFFLFIFALILQGTATSLVKLRWKRHFFCQNVSVRSILKWYILLVAWVY
jgi:hypothetical protein